MVKNNNSFPVSKRDGVINGLIVNIQVFIKINLTAMDGHRGLIRGKTATKDIVSSVGTKH